VRLRFSGTITGLGTASGRRVVIGHWPTSPFGPFADVMVEDRAGHRTLLAPTQEIADFVSATYSFDEVRVVPVTVEGTSVVAGPLTVRLTSGRRTALGRLLRAVPAPLARQTWWATALDPLARSALRGVRTRVTAKEGDREWYAARDQHAITDAVVTWDGVDCGGLTDVVPPVRFGLGSTPSRPSVVLLDSVVERGA
jgi:hypothetical protein